MKSIFVCLFALIISASAVRINSYTNPIIQYVTSTTRDGLPRVDHLEADIYPRHLGQKREDFSTNGRLQTRWLQMKQDNDERGHLVAAQFGGPAEWYNMAPQHKRVNYNRGGRQILTDWANTEKTVKDFIRGGVDRHVRWVVDMKYKLDSIRPDEFTLNVYFFENGVEKPHRGLSLNNIDNEGTRFWEDRQGKSKDR